MHWIAPSEKDTDNAALEKRLWDAANQLWAGAGLKQSEYSEPVLGLIFLRFAEVRFGAQRANLEKAGAKGGNGHSPRRGARVDEPAAYHADGVLYLPAAARFDRLLNLPEGTNIGQAVNDAMRAIERDNSHIAGALPKSYQIFDSRLLAELLKTISTIPSGLEGDAFGKIYEYFVGTFAMSEGQKGGEFFTPLSLVGLIVEVIEPFCGRILDRACGSGGMFVQSARFVAAHKKNPAADLSIHGQERVDGNVRLCRMNLAIHGLEGDIRHGNSYYEDPHHIVGRFRYVSANPPFNVSQVDRERLAAEVGPGHRYPFGLPRTDNANYLWIQEFYSALDEKGRAGFVMANSASDARSSEQEIRRQLIETRSVYVMVAVGPNMFYTVTLPCTLWFLDKGKARSADQRSAALLSRSSPDVEKASGKSQALAAKGSAAGGDTRAPDRSDTVLFIDARHIYRQVDRAHREWTPAQIGFLANLVRLYRGEALDFTLGGDEARAKIQEVFGVPGSARVSRVDFGVAPKSSNDRTKVPGATPATATGTVAFPIQYRDVPGLCRAATLKEIEAQGWSLNPGRYVGVAAGEAVSDEDFKEQLETLNEELETLNAAARELEATIAKNVVEILEA
jgi:type I restriction enzyme M protein